MKLFVKLLLVYKKEDSVISLKDSYLELDVDVEDHATGCTYTTLQERILVHFAPILLFINFKLTAST